MRALDRVPHVASCGWWRWTVTKREMGWAVLTESALELLGLDGTALATKISLRHKSQTTTNELDDRTRSRHTAGHAVQNPPRMSVRPNQAQVKNTLRLFGSELLMRLSDQLDLKT